MESGYVYSKLVDMHLVLGVCDRNDTDAVRRYKEKYPNQRVPNHCTFMSTDCELKTCEHFMECDEMLDIHIVYIMFGWKSNIQGY
jgi:hypothetical protein